MMIMVAIVSTWFVLAVFTAVTLGRVAARGDFEELGSSMDLDHPAVRDRLVDPTLYAVREPSFSV